MLLPGIAEVELSAFNGAVTRLESYTVPADKALYAQNVGFIRGAVSTRLGHSVMFNTADGAITAMRNWFFTFSGVQVSVVAYYAPSVGVRTLQQPTGTTTTIMAATGAAWACIVPTGQRAYVAFSDATGRAGFAGGQVYGWNLGADPLFAAPITNVPTASETAAGVCTPGLRRLGFMMTTRNGYTGKLNPVNSGGVFVPITFTSTGGKNVQLSTPGPFPAYMVGGTLQVVATTVSNLNRYFAVPGATALAGANPTNISFSITDDDLTATGTDVTGLVNLLTCDVSGTPPFKPSAIFSYSNRLGYVVIDPFGNSVIYFSDQNNYQKITADQHAVYIEGQQQAVQGFSLRGVCYIGCTSGVYSTEDNGGVPASWTPPQRIDGAVGILSPTCVAENPALGYALLASERGFYLFQGGIFPPLPLSYYQQSDWGRINWNVPTQVQIGDDQLNRRFIVAAPLNINAIAVTGTGPYTVTTGVPGSQPGTFVNAAHLYQSGLSVKIAGVTGTQIITVTGPNTFTIPGGSGAPTVGGLVQPQTMSHQMVWDYTEGDAPETVKYEIQSFTAYRASALGAIRNLSNLLNEMWYAPAGNGAIIRQNDGSEANPYRDVDMTGAPAAINDLYEMPLIPDPLQAGMTVHDYHGCHLAIRGNGLLSLQAFGLNHVRSVVPARSPLTLQAMPPNEELVKWMLRSERQSLQIGTNAVDHFFVLSLARLYYTDAFPQR